MSHSASAISVLHVFSVAAVLVYNGGAYGQSDSVSGAGNSDSADSGAKLSGSEISMKRWPEYQAKRREYMTRLHTNGGDGSLLNAGFIDYTFLGEWNNRARKFQSGDLKRLTQDEYLDAVYDITGESRTDPLTAAYTSEYKVCYGNGIVPQQASDPDMLQRRRSHYMRDGGPYRCDRTLEGHKTIALGQWLKTHKLVGSQQCNILETTFYEKDRVDGCSVPLTDPASEHFKGVFKKDCNRHDICYGAPKNSKNNKSYCDHEFKTDMLDRCHSIDNKGGYSALCKPTAITWATAVSEVEISQKAYKDGKKWGNTHCGE